MRTTGKMTNSAIESKNPGRPESPGNYHVPVLLNEVIEGLNIKPGGTYVDCTFGGGGHTKAILRQLDANGKMIVFDQDASAKVNVPDDQRVLFIQQNFRHLQRFLRLHKYAAVDGILADLGVSSYQFNEGSRGFSTRFDGPLDMRMDARQDIKAEDILKTSSEKELQNIFEKYGEVTNAKTLAKILVNQRNLYAVKTIGQLKEIIKDIVKGNPNKYLAQVFQALRIVVNDEMNSLKEMLQQSAALLKPGGRIAVISFHSLEDRLVKQFFKNGAFEEKEAVDVFGHRSKPELKVITKKPIIPAGAELKKNPRSSSAKLRVAEKN